MFDVVIRPLINKDLKEVSQIFHLAVLSIKSTDYDLKQLNAWSPAPRKQKFWKERFKNQKVFVAVSENSKKVLGFGSIADDGLIDMLYVSPEYQRKQIATKLLSCLENSLFEVKPQTNRFYAQASAISRPLFEKHGYTVRETLYVEQEEELLLAFSMEKLLFFN